MSETSPRLGHVVFRYRSRRRTMRSDSDHHVLLGYIGVQTENQHNQIKSRATEHDRTKGAVN